MRHSTDLLEPADGTIARGHDMNDAVYPELYNLSARFLFRLLPRPVDPADPEFLYLPVRSRDRLSMIGLMGQWNMAWEAGQLRQQMFGDDLAKFAPQVRLRDDANVYLLPAGKQRLEAYLPLYMLLPRDVIARAGLPPLARATWPHSYVLDREKDRLPADADQRLARAFASQVWPFLMSGSTRQAFRASDPLVLLSHNLDFWLPYAVRVVQDRLRAYGLVEFEDDDADKLEQMRATVPDGVWVDRCRTGGHIWQGRAEAEEALAEVIALAGQDGRLPAIIDAVRSNRVEEDFSARWSFAREDFERKLYSKRSKVRVRFVELEQADTVVGPYSDITENLLWQDFIALLDRKERQVVVCITRGTTKLTDIATELGYANHSPVSKALTRISEKARQLLD